MIKLDPIENIGYTTVNSENAYKRAEEEGLLVVLPDSHTLQIDYDKPAVDERFIELLSTFEDNFEVEQPIIYKQSRRGNLHIIIRLKEEITPTERILLQAALGSDGKREILSFKRIKTGDPTPTLFFETNDAHTTVAL